MLSWFGRKKNKPVKQILVLGNEETGKFTLFQAMRDKVFNPNFEKPALTDFSMNMDDEHHTQLHFLIDSTTMEKKSLPNNPDAVLCIIDLSSDSAEEDYQTYKQLVAIHYPQSKTMFVGTKHDLAQKELNREDLIITSAQTMEGIDAVKHFIEHVANPQQKNNFYQSM